MARQILVVDDDPNIRDVVVFALEKANMDTAQASDGHQALGMVQGGEYDLIVLDINMPEMDGLEACKALRKNSDIPILFLSSRDEEIDKIIGLELGADDYLTKPFSPRELVARVRAILKRTYAIQKQEDTNIHICGALTINKTKHEAAWNGDIVSLTATEFSIISGMAQYPDRVFDRDQIMGMAYSASTYVSDRTVDSHIRNIRNKFAQKGCDALITTLRGVGYKLTP
ncbi:MAG: response regulator transcription factor [Alcanivorax sp.]